MINIARQKTQTNPIPPEGMKKISNSDVNNQSCFVFFFHPKKDHIQ